MERFSEQWRGCMFVLNWYLLGLLTVNLYSIQLVLINHTKTYTPHHHSKSNMSALVGHELVSKLILRFLEAKHLTKLFFIYVTAFVKAFLT